MGFVHVSSQHIGNGGGFKVLIASIGRSAESFPHRGWQSLITSCSHVMNRIFMVHLEHSEVCEERIAFARYLNRKEEGVEFGDSG